MFQLSKRSQMNLQGVHPDLRKVVERAIEITLIDFVVIEGVRSHKRQQELIKKGASWTMDSRHLTGHAVDCAPLMGKEIPWHDWEAFKEVANAMLQAARELKVDVEWGGNWPKKKDGPHFQLARRSYP